MPSRREVRQLSMVHKADSSVFVTCARACTHGFVVGSPREESFVRLEMGRSFRNCASRDIVHQLEDWILLRRYRLSQTEPDPFCPASEVPYKRSCSVGLLAQAVPLIAPRNCTESTSKAKPTLFNRSASHAVLSSEVSAWICKGQYQVVEIFVSYAPQPYSCSAEIDAFGCA